MRRILNWGLLSTARINRALIAPLRASKRTRLLGVASRSQSTAQNYARENHIPRAYGRYEALLADPDIDVIYNSLPNHLHAEWSIKALQAGKHVLCEKPLACSLSEIDDMRAAAVSNGRVLAEAFMYRHHPQTLRVKELLDRGEIGKIQLIRGAFSFTLTRTGNYRFIREMGGGSLWDVGCYPISYARTLIGAEPLEVFGWQIQGAEGIDVSFFGQMRFPNEIHVQFDSGFQSPFRAFMEITGCEGVLTIPQPFKPGKHSELILTRNQHHKKIMVTGTELYSGEVEDMCDAVLDHRPQRISLEDSRANTAVILSLIKSARTKKSVLLEWA